MNLVVSVEDMNCSFAEECTLPSLMKLDCARQDSILGGIQKVRAPGRGCIQDSGLRYLLPYGSDSDSLLVSLGSPQLCSLVLAAKTVCSQLVRPGAFHLLIFRPTIFGDAEAVAEAVANLPKVCQEGEARVEYRTIGWPGGRSPRGSPPRVICCCDVQRSVAVSALETVILSGSEDHLVEVRNIGGVERRRLGQESRGRLQKRCCSCSGGTIVPAHSG